MKLENIKVALKARANSLNLNLQVPATPIVIDAPVSPAPIFPVVTPKTATTKNSSKNPSLQIPLLNTASVDNGDKVVPTPTGFDFRP